MTRALIKASAPRVADLFAGWGGFSVGAEMAGCRCVYAANHWRLAVEAHQANLPHAQHACQDLRQANWATLPDYDVLLAAPACQGHSQASQPKRRRYHDALRATAWAVVDCADVTEPKAIVVENVPDFLRWRLYPIWRSALEQLGYQVTENILVASHHGVPQRRKRLFVVAMQGRAFELDHQPTKEPPFGPHIDWEGGKWRPLSLATTGAQDRIRAAQRRHGPRCLIQHVTGHKGLNLSEPIRTITCQDQWAVADGNRYRPLPIRETARAMGFPDDYFWPESRRRDAIRGLGNAVCPPVARDLVFQVTAQAA